MMKDAEFVEKCIPDSLRLAKHQDAELVNQAIATALLAYRKALRDNVWEKNIASDIARAMSGYMESVYVPHIAKEEEDWGKLQLEAEEARVMKAAQAETKSTEPKESPALQVEVTDMPEPTADNTVTIRSVKKIKGNIGGYSDGWSFNYTGAASGTGEVVHATDGLGGTGYQCELLDEEGEVIASKFSPMAKASLRSAFKKAGLVLSAMPKFAEQVDARPSLESILSERMGDD